MSEIWVLRTDLRGRECPEQVRVLLGISKRVTLASSSLGHWEAQGDDACGVSAGSMLLEATSPHTAL